MKKLVLGLSGATLVVGIAAALLWQQLQAENRNLARLRTQVTEMEKAQVAALASVAPSNMTGAVATTSANIAVATSAAPSGTSTRSAERMREGVVKGLSDVFATEEGRDMTRNLLRSTLAQQFPDLAAELKLTAAETDKFFDLLAKQASESAGDVFGMLGGPSGAASADSQRKMVERQLENQKEIARTLGNKYSAWQEYQGKAAARQQVMQLRSLLGTGQDALSETQFDPLVTALGAEQARISREEQNRMTTAARSSQNLNLIEDQLKSMSVQNERLVTAASAHLTTNQLERYKRMLGQQETMVRSIMGSMNGQGNAAGQGGAAR